MKKSISGIGRGLAIAVIPVVILCSRGPEPFLSPGDFKNPPSNSKVNTWWHWLDGNITKEGITRDLEAMKAQGISQATILNVGLFGNRDFGVPKIAFGSDRWFEMFRWALREADRLGIRIGVHNCDGWSSTGGPWITPEMSMKQFVWTKTRVEGGRKTSIRLKNPFEVRNFYRDAAVVAYRTDEVPNSFRLAAPGIIFNDSTDASILMDGNPVSAVEIKKGDRISISFGAPFDFSGIAVHPRRSFMWNNPEDFECRFTAWASKDGKKYDQVKEFAVRGLNRTGIAPVPPTSARFVRITVDGFGGQDAWIPVLLSELELLKDGETPSFSPEIPGLSEKTASIKPADEVCFYSRSPGRPGRPVPSAKEVIVLTGKMTADGVLEWDAPEGTWDVLRFGYTSTGAVNGPATREGTGLECDKMDAAAVDLHFRNFPKKLAEQAGPFTGSTFRFLLIDSWECGYQNWTAGFPAEFEKRRGYSLIPYLPVLCGEVIGSPEESEAVLSDFRKTVADLIERNYYGHFSDLCHREKLELHAEVMYGNANYPPLDILKSTRCVDLPMYEFWTSTDSQSLVKYTPTAGPEFNLPSCACAGYGKPLLGSEAYTGMAHYSESPRNLKPFGDRAYCAGINRMILHSNVHQPSDRRPGMTLGQFASHFNRNNPYWSHASEWLAYQARIQACLQRGAAAPDVLYYLGDQLPQYFVNTPSNTPPFGYQVNACNFDILKNRVKVLDGKLRMNGVSDYSLLSLPPFPFMDFETLNRIASLVRQGAAVFGPRPQHSLSLTDLSVHQAAFKKLADEVWGGIDGKKVMENKYGKGRVFWGMSLGDALKKISLAPDFSTNRAEDNSFQFIHKKTGEIDVYFVANQRDRMLTRDCAFRVGEKTPEIWNPENGTIEKPAVFRVENGTVRIPVSFKPCQALLFVFKPGMPVESITSVQMDGKPIFPSKNGEDSPAPKVTVEPGGFSVVPVKSADYSFTTRSGKMVSAAYSSPDVVEITDFKGTIRFKPAYQAQIAPLEIRDLRPLTDYAVPDVRYFAGEVLYSIRFHVPEGFASAVDSVVLNVGDFEAAGEVRLNGKSLGGIWNPGTELNVTGLLKADNELEVTIATVFRNRFIGDFIQYGKVVNGWTSSPIGDFLNKKSSLKPSGLMGPLQLIKIKRQMIFSERKG
jgi:hypothetical protein